MKVLRYTVNVNNYEQLKPTPYFGVCMSDMLEETPAKWMTWKIHPFHTDPRKAARHPKLAYHHYFQSEFSLYHDGNIELLVPPHEWVQFLGDCDIAAFKHPQRDCMYDMIENCIRCEADDPNVLKVQRHRYQRAGYPGKLGLFASGVLVRRDTPAMREMCDLWWTELNQCSARDQISLAYALWKTETKCATLPGYLWGTNEDDDREEYQNDLIKIHPHKSRMAV
tara:strand:- start:61 stop:732 length:672 start_codon:yes stop_codon:yes gene_type:complete